MSIFCPKCPPQSTELVDQSQRGAFRCDYCSKSFKKGEKRFRCKTHDLDCCGNCSEQFHQKQQIYCPKCPSHTNYLLDASTRGAFKCDYCKKSFKKGEKRLRCQSHDLDCCGTCSERLVSDTPQPQKQQVIVSVYCPKCPLNTTLLEDASQRGSYRCNYCNSSFGRGDYRLRCQRHDLDCCENCAKKILSEQSVQEQMDIISKEQQKQEMLNLESIESSIPCRRCKASTLTNGKNLNTNWRCDNCNLSFSGQQQERWRCEKDDFDLCGICQTKYQQINELYEQVKMYHSCSTCRCMLSNSTYGAGAWRCNVCSNSFGKSNVQLRLRCQNHDYDICGECVYQQAYKVEMNSGSRLNTGQYISSRNGKYFLLCTNNGRIALFNNNKKFVISEAVWVSETNEYQEKTAYYYVSLQNDGNLCIFNEKNKICWNSGSAGKGVGPYRLVLQDDGYLIIMDTHDQIIYQNKTKDTQKIRQVKGMMAGTVA